MFGKLAELMIAPAGNAPRISARSALICASLEARLNV
jgi:hypothetical protein